MGAAALANRALAGSHLQDARTGRGRRRSVGHRGRLAAQETGVLAREDAFLAGAHARARFAQLESGRADQFLPWIIATSSPIFPNSLWNGVGAISMERCIPILLHTAAARCPFLWDSQTKLETTIYFRFLDSKGQLVIPHRMQLGIAAAAACSKPSAQDRSTSYLHEGAWLGGPMERFVGQNIEGDNFEIAFDGANGRIRRALIDRHSVLYGTPKLHVLPIEATLYEFPIFETWRLTRPLDIHPAGDDYEVVETGTYRDFAGELRFRITPQGGILVNYDFTYTGTDSRGRVKSVCSLACRCGAISCSGAGAANGPSIPTTISAAITE